MDVVLEAKLAINLRSAVARLGWPSGSRVMYPVSQASLERPIR